MFKGYKPHLYASVKIVVLSHTFVPANRHDSVIAPSLLRSSEEFGLDAACALDDAAYDSRELRETAESLGI